MPINRIKEVEMILKGPLDIRLGELLLGEGALQSDRELWHRRALTPEINHETFTDLELLRALLFESTPLIISAPDDEGPVVLDAELVRFPYTIHSANGGKVYRSATGFACFALRLVPRSGGRIAAVELDESGVGVSNLVVETGRRLTAEFGNGKLWFDLYNYPGPHGLGTLQPPRSYEPELTINDEEAID